MMLLLKLPFLLATGHAKNMFKEASLSIKWSEMQKKRINKALLRKQAPYSNDHVCLSVRQQIRFRMITFLS